MDMHDWGVRIEAYAPGLGAEAPSRGSRANFCCSARLHQPSYCARIALDASQNSTASASSAMTAEKKMNGYKRLGFAQTALQLP